MFGLYHLANVIIALSIIGTILNYFSSRNYQLSLQQVITIWLRNINRVYNPLGYVLGFLIFFVFYFIVVNAIVTVVTLTLAGAEYENAYLGNIEQGKGVFYDIADESQKLITGNTTGNYNYSFLNLYETRVTYKTPGSEGIGVTSKLFSTVAYISLAIGFVGFSMFTIIIYNAFVHEVYKLNPTAADLPKKGALKAFDKIVSKYYLSSGIYFTLMIILVILWYIVTALTPDSEVSGPVKPLPREIKAGSTVEGIPNEIRVVFAYKRLPSSDADKKYKLVDSGERYINFSFTEGFSHEVYVATIFDTNDNQEMFDKIMYHFKKSIPMKLQINNNLSISIINELDSNLNE